MEELCDLLEMEEGEGRLQQLACCKAGDETREIHLEERRMR